MDRGRGRVVGERGERADEYGGHRRELRPVGVLLVWAMWMEMGRTTWCGERQVHRGRGRVVGEWGERADEYGGHRRGSNSRGN